LIALRKLQLWSYKLRRLMPYIKKNRRTAFKVMREETLKVIQK